MHPSPIKPVAASGTPQDEQKKSIDLAKVKITRLPRRNDDVYMRGVRRPRA
jgi:hypothetical protein